MSATDSKNISVWLIEDNAIFRKSIERVIGTLDGMSCGGGFSDAESAIAKLKAGERPDVVLLDVQLPGADGITALEEIKKLAPETQAIILTVFDDADKIFRAVCSGASGYVLKGAGMDEIADAIRQVVDGGAPMTPKVAKKVLAAFAKMEVRGGSQNDYGLTAREHEILQLLAEGLVKKEIANRLDISVHTASTHLRNVYDKLHVNTNTGAVAKALREGIIDL